MNFNSLFWLLLLVLAANQSMRAQCAASDMLIPDTLTIADSNGSSQTLEVEAKNIREIKLLVYSRLGKKLFESSSSILNISATTYQVFDTGWDGHLEGARLKEGLYVYMLEAQCADRSTVRKSGSIILSNQLVP